MHTAELAAYLDNLLKVSDTPDYPTALNGLQVENSGSVSRLAVAVDASEQAIKATVKAGCNFLVVHHGLFWDGPGRVVGRRYRRLKLLLDNDVAVYSSHIPLDVHPELGNSAQLAKALGIHIRGTFGLFQQLPIGVSGDLEIRREALAARLDDLLSVRVKLIPGGPEIISRVGVVTGAAASMIGEAVDAQLDAFITGEGSHHTYFDAMENGINVYYAGHYATETFGVRALGQHVEDKFGLPWEFIDLPTGL
jgi:dinuclear metal center YbgI/SA1388 family protein